MLQFWNKKYKVRCSTYKWKSRQNGRREDLQ